MRSSVSRVTDTYAPRRIESFSAWLRLLAGLGVVFGLFQWSATALESNRGEAGLLVGLIVVAALLVVERLLFDRSVPTASRSLGFGVPHPRGLRLVIGIAALMAVVILTFVGVTGARLTLLPGWLWLLPGLFAQGGIAEEALFRGYLFRHLRVGRSFWRAAVLSTIPFVTVHLSLFWTMPWPIATAAILLSVALAAPLAHLFEAGGWTIWAPALLHFIIQGTVKVIVFPEDVSSTFALWWMAAAAVLPWTVFLWRVTPSPRRPLR